MALPAGGEAKTRKIRAIVTPELFAKNYDLLTQLLGAALSMKDVDELGAMLRGTTRSEDDILDQLEVAKAFFPKDTDPKIHPIKKNSWSSLTDGHALRGVLTFPMEMSTRHQDGSITKKVETKKYTYDLRFEKQKWTASIYNDWGKETGKRFDDDGEAVKWLLRQIVNVPKKYAPK
jgi:hypothetical protein